MLLCLLCACGGKETDTLSGPMALRQALLTSESVTADLDVTLPDEDAVWQFSMHAVLTPEGSMDAEITAPESVSGIRAKADDLGRQLAFDGAMVDLNSLPAEERSKFGSITPAAATFMGIGGASNHGFANNGILTIATYYCSDNTLGQFLAYLIGIAVAFFGAAILTYIVGFEDDSDEALNKQI